MEPLEKRPVSLRVNFAWTLAGNVFQGASQWAVLSLIAKLGNSEMLGQYALAVAVATPAAMLFHLNLRAVLATDIARRRPFGDYIAARLMSALAGLSAIAAIALVAGYPRTVTLGILIIGFSLSIENVIDIYYGAMQRRERMDRIARSMIARGSLSVTALGLALWLSRDLIPAVMALACGRVIVLLAYDRPKGSAGEDLSRSGLSGELGILRTALPLGIVLMLVSLNANIPRYLIEHYLGTRELGAFAAAASFLAAGSALIHALGQSAMPRLARHFSEKDLSRFRRLAFKLTGLGLLLGLAGVLGAVVLGRILLSLLYRPEYAAYGELLVAIMGAGSLMYIATTLGYIITSARAFAAQLPLFCAVAASSAMASWLLVPVMGLYGAALALAVSACVQIGGMCFILRRALHRMEAAA